MTKLASTTSGFVLPVSSYFTPFDLQKSLADDLLNRSSYNKVNDFQLDFFRDNQIHTSSTLTNLYTQYKRDNSYDNFILLVDAATEVFKEINLIDFIGAQISNPFLSATSMMFLKDLVSGNLSVISPYNGVPAMSRFNFTTTLTSGKVNDQTEKFVSDVQKLAKPSSGFHKSWVTLMSELMLNKPDFVLFYRYLLVHSY